MLTGLKYGEDKLWAVINYNYIVRRSAITAGPLLGNMFNFYVTVKLITKLYRG